MFDPDIYVRYYEQRKKEEAAAKMGLLSKSRVIPSADQADVMREQLEDLLSHGTSESCGCSLCRRYLEVEPPLMRPFEETADSMKARGV